MRYYLKDITFKEAYSRTGRILNVTVSNMENGESEIINHITNPNVAIWSAVVASCALPIVFPSAYLQAKDPVTKQLFPLPTRYADGSIQGDIPIQKLSEEFECSYFIVAQANPHVLFYMTFGEYLSCVLSERRSNLTILVQLKCSTICRWETLYSMPA